LRVASQNAKFGQTEANHGIIPGYGGTQRLTQLIGKSKSMEFMMTCDMFSAEEAEKFGLVNYVVPQAELMSKALEIMKKIFKKSPSAVKGIINSVNAYYEYDKDGFLKERMEFKRCVSEQDFSEGTKAFIEKRKPDFK
jgi:enoyl-CoA hydratase